MNKMLCVDIRNFITWKIQAKYLQETKYKWIAIENHKIEDAKIAERKKREISNKKKSRITTTSTIIIIIIIIRRPITKQMKGQIIM